jgi:hypothetical protein
MRRFTETEAVGFGNGQEGRITTGQQELNVAAARARIPQVTAQSGSHQAMSNTQQQPQRARGQAVAQLPGTPSRSPVASTDPEHARHFQVAQAG